MAKPTEGEVKLVKKRAGLEVAPKKSTRSKAKTKKAASLATTTKVKAKKKTKMLVVRELSDDARKIKIIENITRRPNKSSPSQVQKNDVLVDLRNKVLLTVSSVQFDHAHAASSIARYAGVTFVALGAFFTLYHMSGVLAPQENVMVAQTISGTTEGITTTTDTTVLNTTNTTIDRDPDPDFRIESSSSALTGEVPITVNVPNAKRIDLVAFNEETKSLVQLGSMSRVSDLAWKAHWDTSRFDDGRYTLKAVVVNEYGSYTKEDVIEYTVANHPIDDETTTGATTTETGGTELSVNSLPTLKVELDEDSDRLQGTVKIQIYVSEARNVLVYARKHGSRESVLLGYASLHDKGEWRFVWDTTKTPNETYDLIVQAIFDKDLSRSHTVDTLTVQNEQSDQTEPEEEIEEPSDEALEPEVTLRMTGTNPLSGILDIHVSARGVKSVELYTLPEKSLIPKFLGLANQQDESGWRYRFDTTRLPNGTYELYAHTRHAYGETQSKKVLIKIQNTTAVSLTPQNKEYVGTLEKTGNEVNEIVRINTEVDTSTGTSTEKNTLRIQDTSPYTAITEEVAEEFRTETAAAVSRFREELDRIIKTYSKALREKDEARVQSLQQELEGLRSQVLLEIPKGVDQTEIIEKINGHVSRIIDDHRERVERSETLIRERMGEAVTKDSDMDGISDYDEVNLYATNPFSADSDQDGFNDDVEILNGYDPQDSIREINLVYESPKEQGIVREDLLTIDHIVTVADRESVGSPKAHMGGKALPRSFVTLYIFSTPIVVTVKTDDEGNWSYLFDKELEEGEHEMYVGITDNAGKIVAKSAPLTFVKTAEAFTPLVDAEEVEHIVPTPEEPSLLSQNALFVVASLAVVSLGLVLILLGLHVRPKDPEPLIA